MDAGQREALFTNTSSSFAGNWSAVTGAASYDVAFGSSPFYTSLGFFGNVGNVNQATIPPFGLHLP